MYTYIFSPFEVDFGSQGLELWPPTFSRSQEKMCQRRVENSDTLGRGDWESPEASLQKEGGFFLGGGGVTCRYGVIDFRICDRFQYITRNVSTSCFDIRILISQKGASVLIARRGGEALANAAHRTYMYIHICACVLMMMFIIIIILKCCF